MEGEEEGGREREGEGEGEEEGRGRERERERIQSGVHIITLRNSNPRHTAC